MITSEQFVSLGKRRQSAIILAMGALLCLPAPIVSPRGEHVKLGDLASPSDTKTLIETAVNRFLEEVPALQPLKLVAGLELRPNRGETQFYRVELPGPKISKDIAADAKVRIELQRAKFNELATKGTVRAWREAFVTGEAKATGIDQVMRLIVQVVERQEERERTRRATHR
jgi:hypothetical protein